MGGGGSTYIVNVRVDALGQFMSSLGVGSVDVADVVGQRDKAAIGFEYAVDFLPKDIPVEIVACGG